MSSAPSVTQWTQLVATQLPHLSRPQATVLALWSLGLVLARSCGLTAVSVFLAGLQDRKENTVRQQLREWCYEAPAKRGAQRQALVVEACFAPLLRWVLHWWQGPQLALALDATTLGDRFAVLAISVLYRGCAIPVAWAVLPATVTGAWKIEWLRLLQHLHATVPATMTVIVLADRGAVCPLAVSGHCPPGVAPPATGQRRGTVSAPGPGALAAIIQLRPRAGHALARPRPGVQDPPAGVYPAGLLGTRAGRPVVADDGLAPRRQQRGLVWLAGLDRAGLQADQTRRLAVATHPHDPPGAGGAPVAGRGGGHLVVGERGGRRRRHHCLQYGA